MKLILPILLFAAIAVAGDAYRMGTTTRSYFLQGIPVGYFNSIGFSNITSVSAAEISGANPASLANFSSLEVGINFAYWTQTDYVYGIQISRPKQWLPSSFGFIYPFKNFHFGLAYRQKYAEYMDYGDIEILTVQNPMGTGEFHHFTDETIIHSPSAILAYSLHNLFNAEDCLSFGLQISWDVWREEESIAESKGRINADYLSFKIGTLYRPNQQLAFGAFYARGDDLKGEFEFDSMLPAIPDPGSFVQIPVTYNFKLPDELAFGLSAKTVENLSLSATLNAVFWSQVYNEYQDQLDFSVGTIYSLSDRLAFSLGFYQTDRNLKGDNIYTGYAHNASFAGTGVRGRIWNMDLRLEILDSHLFSAKYMKQTRIKLGMDYRFK